MAKDFKSMNTYDQDTLMIVDSLNLAFRWKHQGALEFMEDYHRTVESLRKSYKAGKVIIAADQGSSSYRKDIYPEYKQNRKDKAEQQTEEEKVYFELFFKEFKFILESFKESTNYPVLQFNKVEADDIAAYIVKIRKKYNIKKIVLISSDRDWDLLIDLDVMRFSYVTRKETTLENWNTHYDCEPHEYISIKCLQGDPGDNVPGVVKVGPVTAKKLINEYGSALDLAAELPLPGKLVYIKNLNAFGLEGIIRNYKLMDLLSYCGDAIGEENCKEIEKVLNEYCSIT